MEAIEAGTRWRGSKGPVCACRLNTNERSRFGFHLGFNATTPGPNSVSPPPAGATSNGANGAGEVRCQSDKASPVFSFCSRNGNGLEVNIKLMKKHINVIVAEGF